VHSVKGFAKVYKDSPQLLPIPSGLVYDVAQGEQGIKATLTLPKTTLRWRPHTKLLNMRVQPGLHCSF
jgi:hypothetical protein